MSTILLCQSPDSELVGLGPALLRKDYAVVVRPDVAALDYEPEFERIDLALVDACGSLDERACCQAVSRAWPNAPLILLVPEHSVVDIESTNLTAESVLQLPFTPRKVVNRIETLLCARSEDVLRAGDLTLNVQTRCVHRGDDVYRLTPKQAKLLQVFIQNAGRTLTRKFLMERVWETNYMGDTRTLDVHVRWIRERIEENPSSPRFLRTVRGVGYRFAVPSEEDPIY